MKPIARASGGQPSGGQPSGGQPSGGQPSGGQPSGGQPSGGQPSGIVTLLTDFGVRDPFVGVVKGVLCALTPAVRPVDLTHEIPPQRITAGAFWLSRTYGYFPAGTVHLAVVDPGVGTGRRALAVAAAGHFFVGPDNGVLSGLLGEAEAVHAIDMEEMGRQLVSCLPTALATSATFHGRDVFAPAAALLAGGKGLTAVGPALTGAAPVRLASGETRVEVIDHFGNLITNLDGAAAQGRGVVRIGGRDLRWVHTYADAQPGECVALLGSFGTIEIAVRNGSAARELEVAPGEPVSVCVNESS